MRSHWEPLPIRGIFWRVGGEGAAGDVLSTAKVNFFIDRLEAVGRFGLFLWDVLRCAFRRPVRFKLMLEQMEKIGVDSVPIIALSSLAIGAIFALQMVSFLTPFRAEIATGSAVALTMAREFAPVVTTLMLIAKNGSAMAAELGTMKVTEQLDAMATMSVDPVHYLVVPRVVAAFFMFPVLTLLANVIGVFGAFIVATGAYELEAATYLEQMFLFVSPNDIYSGLIKAAVMGVIVATICTYHGLHSQTGARGVGESSTRAVVASSVAILIADYLMATVMMAVMY